MSNPEQNAFLNAGKDSVDENLQTQTDATAHMQKEVIQARVEQGDKIVPKEVTDKVDHGKALLEHMASMQAKAASLPGDMLADVFKQNQGYVDRILLAGIDPNDPRTRDAVMNAIRSAATA